MFLVLGVLYFQLSQILRQLKIAPHLHLSTRYFFVKKAVRVKVSAISKAQKQAAKDLEDYKRGELKTFKMNSKFWDEMDEIIEKMEKENESRA